jgi:glyoxylase-like metal-dependent hydrolase (beta-lactamase superfamily II)
MPDPTTVPDSALADATAIVRSAVARSTLRPQVKAFFDETTFTVTYVVRDPQSKACTILDSVLDYDPASGRTAHASADAVIAYVQAEGLEVVWQLETHAHADHLSAADYMRSRSHAKIAIGARIVDAGTGAVPTNRRLLVRYLGYYVSTLPLMLGFLWIAFDPRKQGWHDKMAGTVVVRPRRRGRPDGH